MIKLFFLAVISQYGSVVLQVESISCEQAYKDLVDQLDESVLVINQCLGNSDTEMELLHQWSDKIPDLQPVVAKEKVVI